MRKLSAIVAKELLLLLRDRFGLLILFLMPAVLVLVVSLVQENVIKTSIKVLFVDNDKQFLGKEIEKQFEKSSSMEIVKELNDEIITETTAHEAVANGDFQFCIIIPKGTTEAVQKRTRGLVEKSLHKSTSKISDTKERENKAISDIIVYFDPTVQGAFRSALISSLERVVTGMEMMAKNRALFAMLPGYIKETLQSYTGFSLPMEPDKIIPNIDSFWSNKPILGIKENFATLYGFKKMPTSVQQNVPAWALFGIFFIVLPMSGSMIKDKQDGMLQRILTMPVSYINLMGGKIISYILVCTIQFVFVLLIGKFLLPLLGTPALEMGSDPLAVMIIVFTSILAATGYGILLGTLCRTFEQASSIGPISVVIAAAIGGVMVPVYAMPKIMQEISLFSPLAWGLNGFYDILVRGGNVSDILFEALLLFSFFILTLLAACFYMFRTRKLVF
ncbi:MAG: ABC transporter permease [Desulfobacterales bacterium]|nr:ABC transporter permease [Desulfobacterales bacterium]